MIVEPTEEMLRAGQEALFEVCPEYTIEEREGVAREVWAAMGVAAGYFGGTPKSDPDYTESEAALREREACAAICEREAEHNGLGAGWHLADLIRERPNVEFTGSP
jgi:hypothetical protein